MVNRRRPSYIVALAVLICIGPTVNAAQSPSVPGRNQPPAAPTGKQPTSPTGTQAPSVPTNQASSAPTNQTSAVPTNQTSAAPAKPAASGRNETSSAPARNPPPSGAPLPAGVTAPEDYLIGPDDVLTIVFWREKDMSGDATVRPDGRISLPLINDIQAAGLTPEQLRVSITEASGKYIEQPTVAVVVKTINSRKVFITGQVAKQGVFPLSGPTTVMQLITIAGGLLEYADEKNISIVRNEKGRALSFRFNYDEVKKRKNLNQNIELKPGDTIVVP